MADPVPPVKRTNAAIWLWYRGTRYLGFQLQPGRDTVQGRLREALGAIGVPGTPMPAGRTDKGVHARMQVVSVRVPAEVAVSGLAGALAQQLPPDLGLSGAVAAPRGFHAQWSSVGKEYRYRIRLAPGESIAWEPYAWSLSGERPPLSRVRPERIAELLARCVGTRDFHAFHESSSVRKPRTLHSATLQQLGPGVLELRLRGDSFARYQVRYLVGSVIAAAGGALPEELLLAGLERAQSFPGLKAPAHGLTLWEVLYPAALDPFAPWRARPPSLPNEPPFCTS